MRLIARLRNFSRQAPLLRFNVLRRIGKWVLPAYRFKWPQMAWWADPAFNAYLTRFNEANGMNTDRRWMLYQLMRFAKDVPGDTAECGAYEGAGSFMMCRMNALNSNLARQHHVFDSFEGLSAPAAIDGAHWRPGDLAVGLEQVSGNLAEFSNVVLHKGWIPDRFPEVADRRFAFVHIDVDLYQPTLDSVAFFYPRMSEGGIILCDDYGFTSCPGATEAINEFLADKPERMISLSCGGGFMIKGRATSGPLPTSAFAG